MIEFTVTYNKKEIPVLLSTFISVEEKVEYLNFLLGIYEKVLLLFSDIDIAAFIDENNLNEFSKKVYNDPVDNIKRINSIKKIYEIDLRYISRKYSNFQFGFLMLIITAQSKLEAMRISKTIIEEEFELLFDEYSIEEKINSFNNIELAKEWLSLFNDKIYSISHYFDNYFYDILFKKYHLDDLFPLIKESKVLEYDDGNSIYRPFKEYLDNSLIPFIGIHLEDIEFNIRMKEDPEKYIKNQIPVEQKFPYWSYRYDKIKAYEAAVLLKLEDKIEYYIHLLKIYSSVRTLLRIRRIEGDECYSKLQKRLEFNKSLYELEKNKKEADFNTPALLNEIKDIIKEKNEKKKKILRVSKKVNTSLIKHYFDVATQIDDVPNSGRLESDLACKSTWDRKFKDILFLAELLKKIESKFNRKNISEDSKKLLNDIKSNIDLKVQEIRAEEASKVGQVYKKKPDYKENYKKGNNSQSDTDYEDDISNEIASEFDTFTSS